MPNIFEDLGILGATTGIAHVDSSGIMDSSLIVNADIDAAAAIVDTKLATISTVGKVSNSATTATSSNTTSTIVARDASGNFSAGVITAALSGTASSATQLLNARNIYGGSFNGTADLPGPVGLTYGGTNASLTASNGGIVWSNATQLQILSGTATAGQMLRSGSSATPAWSTATWPSTTTANQLLYSSATNTVTGLATDAFCALVTDGSGVPSISATLPDNVQANITRVGAQSALSASAPVFTDAGKFLTSTQPGAGITWTVPQTYSGTFTFNTTPVPGTTLTYDFGNTTNRWNKIWTSQLQTDGILDNGSTIALSSATSITATLTTRAIAADSNNARDIGAVATAFQDIYAYTLNLNPNTSNAAIMRTNRAVPSGSLSGNAPALAHNGIDALFWNSSGFIAISGNTAYKTAGSSWTASSDERLKKNIEDFQQGLETVLAIRPRLFHYKSQDESEQKHAGIIAQELQQVYPRAISKGGDEMLNFDANDLPFLLINAVKELTSRIEALEEMTA